MKQLTVMLVCGLLLAPASVFGDIVGGDDFDGGGIYLTRTIMPDNSANDPVGSFPNGRFDVFGITNRDVNYDFADDSAGSYPADTFGILNTGETDWVFGVEDLENADNPSGTGTATWTFDISGYTDLAVSIEFASMGDFEAADNYGFAASIDGGPAQTLFASVIREDLDPYTYYMESGTPVEINDPVEVNGVVLNTDFQALSAAVTGTGDVLTLTFDALNNGGSEVFIFDYIVVTGIPEPASLGLMLLGGLALIRRNRGA